MFGARGDNTIDARAGNDFVWTGRGNDNADGGTGNDFIATGRGNDNLNGGAGNDRVHAGSGNDTGIYNVSENSGSKDFYDGGRGSDVLVLQMTHAEFASANVQADLAAFDSFLAGQRGCWWKQSFEFHSFDLKVKNWESYEIQFTDDAPPPPDPGNQTPANQAPQAAGDTLHLSADFAPIQELEPNDPGGGVVPATPQIIERSSFKAAPSGEVDNDALPRVVITGTISGAMPTSGPDANDVDVFAITLKAGETLILDVDHAFLPTSQMNAQIFVMDESGTVLMENDDAPTTAGGGGSTSVRDPYLEFSEPGTGGTYHVAISTWNNDPQGSSGTFNDQGFMPGDYVLNVSIDNPAPDLGAFVISADELLANDTDADGDGLVLTSVGNPVNGSVELSDSGDVLFKPDTDAPASFEYTVSDGNGGESTATVAVNGSIVTGTQGGDVLVSTPEAELFFGKAGADSFNFSPGSGNDAIADFAVGEDLLDVSADGTVAGVEALDGGTAVHFDSGDSVLLVGVSDVADVNDLFA